ncbi:hypothetical protein Rcae01_01004 [Novipirellula caenicola]|uniref:Uncharacterized protein n=1 Tax=Novipirellula caenicola TaxID=1536901 RepID=A0ABP9VK30_9BACT
MTLFTSEKEGNQIRQASIVAEHRQSHSVHLADCVAAKSRRLRTPAGCGGAVRKFRPQIRFGGSEADVAETGGGLLID